MPSPRSVRVTDDVLTRLTDLAARRGASVSSVMERLLDEALRREAHPLVTFRDGPSGRRAGLVAGPDIDEVVRTVRLVHDGDAGSTVQDVVAAVAESMTLRPAQVRAAVAYYADHRVEVDERIATGDRAADIAEAAWQQQQEILAGRTA